MLHTMVQRYKKSLDMDASINKNIHFHNKYVYFSPKIIVESDEAVDVTTESTENQGAGEGTAPT